jgi:hypothetical protein
MSAADLSVKLFDVKANAPAIAKAAWYAMSLTLGTATLLDHLAIGVRQSWRPVDCAACLCLVTLVTLAALGFARCLLRQVDARLLHGTVRQGLCGAYLSCAWMQRGAENCRE